MCVCMRTQTHTLINSVFHRQGIKYFMATESSPNHDLETLSCSWVRYETEPSSVLMRPVSQVSIGRIFDFYWGSWVAQSVEHLTLGFGSGHDLTVSWGLESHIRL